MESFVQRFYREAKEYQEQYHMSDEWLGFAMGYCLFQPVVASSEIPSLLDTARKEYTTIKDGIDGIGRGKNPTSL